MNVDAIITLLNAGYTKEEINALYTPDTAPAPVAEPAPEPVPEPIPEPVPTQAPAPTQPTPKVPEGVMLTQSQFDALLQTVRAGNSGIAVPPKYDLDNVLGQHFATLLTGKES